MAVGAVGVAGVAAAALYMGRHVHVNFTSCEADGFPTEEIYSDLFAEGLHAWTGAKVTLWTACPQFVVLGPLFHVLNGACGSAKAVLLAALAETLLTMLGSNCNVLFLSCW